MERQKKVFTFALYINGGKDLVEIKVIDTDEESARRTVTKFLCDRVETKDTGLYLNDVHNY